VKSSLSFNKYAQQLPALPPQFLMQYALQLKHYQDEYGHGNWWSWDAHKTDALNEIPAFPVKG